MTPSPDAVRLIGHQRRFADAIAQIDTELEFALGAAVAARRDEVVAAARAAYGPSEDFRGVRDAWDAVFPDGVYTAATSLIRRCGRRPSAMIGPWTSMTEGHASVPSTKMERS